MVRVYLILAEGFEEIEAIASVDILRRADIDVITVSLEGDKNVTGSHNVTVKADISFSEIDGEADMIILPGGPGRRNYYIHEALGELVKRQNTEGKYIAAICGAPAYLARLGILEGKTVVCHPSEEDNLVNAVLGSNVVEVDGNIITSKSAGTTIPFALKIVEILKDGEIVAL